MALICMACYDTTDNNRSDYSRKTLDSLLRTVDFYKHRLAIIDNGSCQETLDIIEHFSKKFPNPANLFLIYNQQNLGTAKAINKGLKYRLPFEHVIKMDNDCVIDNINWVDDMEECISRDSSIGIVALKRMDLQDNPTHSNSYYRSELIMLPHHIGQKWIVVEKVNHIIGTCEMISASLLDKIGGFEQPTVYGYDDTIIFLKSSLLKYKNVYLPHIVIHRIDTGGTEHTRWKVDHSNENRQIFEKYMTDLKKGRRPLFYDISREG